MGVPALFRWLSKKYPKIILPVVEEDETKLPNGDGTSIAVPVDISKPNPNGTEFDNLYLDMNGIVHPCTHPEGKPAPETEEEMMIEIFKYTERVVNMIRPRKLLFMAIDGVAPRAKMNQQRSRRFRSAQEAKEKEEARKEAVAMFEAMGQTVSDETKNQKAWDSNAITPGTPFMDLLASCLRYWVTDKINTDPGWKNLQVILSDASVPGEGEHKIMDFIRRQRTNPHHDPNTRHVIYGLDADLIMLSLATHEPHFRVLREDVFFQEGSRTACRICGQEGHYAAQCTGEAKPKQDQHDVVQKEPEKKPFIFLDVSILREYLEVELNVPQAPFAFDLERALDDWVLLIFFVGNDFLPHLPSLEIREGAIDTLLRIWKEELPRMCGYLTNHGHIELPRLEIILEGLARREDDIFRRRREAEERQDQNAKRRRIEENGQAAGKKEVEGGMRMSEATYVPVEVSNEPPIHPSLPNRPAFNMVPAPSPAPAPAPGANPSQKDFNLTTNHDVVANRRALRLANMSAAELLKTELATRAAQKQSQSGARRGSKPQSSFGPLKPDEAVVVPHVKPADTDVPVEPPPLQRPSDGPATAYGDYANMDVLPGLGGPLATGWGTPTDDDNGRGISAPSVLEPPSIGSVEENQPHDDAGSNSHSVGGVISPPPPDLVPATGLEDAPKEENGDADADADGDVDADAEGDVDENESMDTNVSANGAEGDPNTAAVAGATDVMNTLASAEQSVHPHGVKRKHEEVEAEEEGSGVDEEEDDEAPPDVIGAVMPRKVHPDGTVEQEDTVRLWEPGYKERYYKQKFGVELSDIEFRKQITKCYVEGLSWVLHYYYQGTPSWQWYYPYHYAPFASDFEEVSKMEIKFEIGQPFKAFEQLMGVFPAASRQHIPKPLQDLMVDEESPIIDFYPTTFEIDMNGKKMAWQGVALLPFIDEKRLLDAMSPRLSMLTDEEVRRNKWGSNVLFVGKDHPLHSFLSGLYVKRKSNDAITLDTRLSGGIAGSTLPDSQCIPDSTYFSPFVERDMPDIPDNKSISALYYYPRQLKPHRSQLLPGIKRPMRVLTSADFETLHRRGGGGRGRGRGGGISDNHGTGYGGYGAGRGVPYNQQPYGGAGGYDRNTGYGYGYGYGSYGNHSGSGGYTASHYNYQDNHHSSNGTMGGRGGYSSSSQSSTSYGSHGYGRGYGQQSHHGAYGHSGSSNTSNYGGGRGRDRGGHY